MSPAHSHITKDLQILKKKIELDAFSFFSHKLLIAERTAALAFEPAKVSSEYQEQINDFKEQNDELGKDLGEAATKFVR